MRDKHDPETRGLLRSRLVRVLDEQAAGDLTPTKRTCRTCRHGRKMGQYIVCHSQRSDGVRRWIVRHVPDCLAETDPDPPETCPGGR